MLKRNQRPTNSTVHEAAHAGVLCPEAVVAHQVLVDRHRVPSVFRRLLDQFAKRLTRTGSRGPARGRGRRGPVRGGGCRGGGCADQHRVGGHLRTVCRFCPGEVGGHLFGRFCCVAPPPVRDRDGRRLQVGAGGLPPHANCGLNASQQPSQPPQRDHLLSLLLAQDVCHPGGETCLARLRQRPGVPVSFGRFSALHHWPVLGVHQGIRTALGVRARQRQVESWGACSVLRDPSLPYGRDLAPEMVPLSAK